MKPHCEIAHKHKKKKNLICLLFTPYGKLEKTLVKAD